MQFPDSKLPPLAPVTDRTEITPKAPISPALKVAPGFKEAMNQGAGQPHQQDVADMASRGSRYQAVAYSGEERRVFCRRIYRPPVLLDTRGREERRKHDLLGGQLPTHMDEKA